MNSLNIRGPQGSLAVIMSGSGPATPILFLHADAGNIEQWHEVMRVLALTRGVAGFDFRGHGASAPASNGDYSFNGRSEDVGAVVDELAWQRFIIVAHSGGAAVALSFALRAAARVAGLLLVDPPTDPRKMPPEIRDGYLAAVAKGPANEVVKEFYGSIAGGNPSTRDRILADVDRTQDAALAGVARELAEWNPEPVMKGITVPMEILVSPANDNPAALYRLRGDVPHHSISPSGHWLQLDQPQAVLQAIERFAGSVS